MSLVRSDWKLTEILHRGIAPAQLAFDNRQNCRDGLDWHAKVSVPHRAFSELPTYPLITVVMATYNRTDSVLEAVAGLRTNVHQFEGNRGR